MKYIFDFTIYSFIPLPPGRGAAVSPALYKRLLSPLICFPRHPEMWRERGGVREGVNGESLSDFGSEPQVINISQLSQSKFFVCLIL
jgi:hypothetical protein